MENQLLWEDWEGITEEEVDFCFERLDCWDGVHCDECQASFPTVKELKKHFRLHKVPAPTPSITDDNIQEIVSNACTAAKKLNPDVPDPQNLNFEKIQALVRLLHAKRVAGSLDHFYQFYANICHGASNLLQLPQNQAAMLLIKLFDALVQLKEEEVKRYTKGVDPRECDVLEYIGGHLLHKMSTHHSGEIAQCLTSDTPSGKLIQKMERKQNRLFYPSDDYNNILIRIFILHNKETAQSAKAIRFSKILKEIEEDPYYEKLIQKTALKSGKSYDEVFEAISKSMKHLLTILGHNYAKFALLTKQVKLSKYAKPLRETLKTADKR